jgi:glycosyltransferase involved in cell wall biosynthesis
MRVAVVTKSIDPFDAVSNDALMMARVLNASGHEAQAYSELPSTVDEALPLKRLVRPDLLIYHHSIGCEPGVRLLEQLDCARMVKWHNITPREYFDHIPTLQGWIDEGRAQLPRLKPFRTYSDSDWNRREIGHGEVLAPFTQCRELLMQPPLNLPSVGERQVLMVGRITPSKNVIRAVETIALVPGATLILVGHMDPLYSPRLQQAVSERGLDKRVRYVGQVDQGILANLYRSADALLLPSLHEGFSVPVVEALAFNVPIVCGNWTAAAETAGPYGIVVEEDSAAAFAAGLRRAFETKAASHGYFREHFSLAAITARFLEAVSAALAGVDQGAAARGA